MKSPLLRSLLIYTGFFIILAIIFAQKNIIIDSFFELIVDPKNTFYSLFFSWYSLMYFGINNSPVYSYIFPFGFFYWSFSQFFSIQTVQTLIFAIVGTVSFFSFNTFVSEELKKKSNYIYIGGLLYVFNMYTLLNYGTTVFLLPYAILPLQLYFLRKILLSKHHFIHAIGFAGTTIFMTGINPPLVAINLIVMFFYVVHLLINYSLLTEYKKVILKLFLPFIFSLLFNFYWILGVISYYTTLSTTEYAAVLSEPLSMQNAASNYLNIFRSLGVWSFNQGWAGKPYYNYASAYLNNPFFQLSLFLPLILAITGIIYIKDAMKKYLYMLLLLIFSIAMAVGSNQGIFKDLYVWSYNHIPMFSMFRSSYKFVAVYIFTIAFFISVLLVNLKNTRIKNIFSGFLIVTILINAFPFFTNRVFEESKQIKGIPAHYYEAKKFFDADQTSHRILLLPEQYFATYTWGFTVGNPEIIWNKSLVTRQAGSSLLPNNTLSIEIWDKLFQKKYKEVNTLLNKTNVRYIVQRNDFDWQYYQEDSHSPQAVKKILAPYKKIQTIGALDIYEVPTTFQNALIRAKSAVFQKNNAVKYRIYLKNIDSKQNLSFLETFNPNWNIYLEKNPSQDWCEKLETYDSPDVTECKTNNSFFSLEDLMYLTKKPLLEETHKTIYTYGNEWTIDPDYIKNNYSHEYYSTNEDGSINIELTLYFKLQSYFYVGLAITLISCILSGLYLIYFYLIRSKRTQQ